MPTADDIADTIAQTAADGVQSATVDGNSATATPIADLIAAEQHTAAKNALAGSNACGGPVSPWGRMLRPARGIPPGGV